MNSVQKLKNYNTTTSHIGGVQGKSEQRNELYMKYYERAAELLTKQSAISDGGTSGSARRQVIAVGSCR